SGPSERQRKLRALPGTAFGRRIVIDYEYNSRRVLPCCFPDGRRLAFVSNQMGNIDVLFMPVSGGEREHLRITGLKFRQPSGSMRLWVRDDLGRPTAARLYLRASDGKSYSPRGSPIFYYPLPAGGEREGFFIGSGDDTLSAPAGPARVVALKGTEYR